MLFIITDDLIETGFAMKTKTYLFNIRERDTTPSAKLFVERIYDDEESLSTKPYIFIFPGGPGTNHSHYKDYK